LVYADAGTMPLVLLLAAADEPIAHPDTGMGIRTALVSHCLPNFFVLLEVARHSVIEDQIRLHNDSSKITTHCKHDYLHHLRCTILMQHAVAVG